MQAHVCTRTKHFCQPWQQPKGNRKQAAACHKSQSLKLVPGLV